MMASGEVRVHMASMAYAETPPRLHMDARLTPHRSLPKAGFVALLIGLAAYNIVVAAFLVVIGAYPVPIFLGLDFLAVFIAFKVSYGRAAFGERVQVTSDDVRVLHGRDRDERTVWRSPTAFTRVQVDRPGRHDAHVRLRLSGKALRIGAGLGPQERADFARALEQAIRSARMERY